MSGPSSLLQPLEQAESVGQLGNKAVNLGRLLRDGFPVPPGMVIPDRVLQGHLRQCGLTTQIDALFSQLDRLNRREIRRTSQSLCERVIATPLDRTLRDELARRHVEHWLGRRLAVRSSAVAEDSAQASFAGQLDTFLGIETLAELELAIRRTWASLWSERALLYSRHKGLRPRHMGVLLQEQVDARWSGVLFTRDPGSQHADCMLVEYCPGLGDALVSGAITPASLRIARHDLTLLGDPPLSAAGQIDSLQRVGLLAVARMALEVERRCALAQDIEWSIDARGEAVLLQARPISAVANESSPVRVYWTNANIAENFPEPVSPFLYSLVRPGYSAYFRNLALGFGLSQDRVNAMRDALENIVGVHAGRLYYNLTNIHTVLRLAPGGRWLVRSFNLFVGAADIPEPAPANMGRIERLREALWILAKTTWQYLWVQRRVRSFERRVDEYARQTHPDLLPGKSTDALQRDLRRFLEIRLEQWNDAALADCAAMVCYGLLKTELARQLGAGEDAALHNQLLKGLPGLASAEPVTKLWELAQWLRAQQRLRETFETSTAEMILARLQEPEWQAFRERLAIYLDRWGFRSSGELMLTTLTPQENPLPVLRLLQAYLREATLSPESVSRAQVRARETTTAAVASRLSSWNPARAMFPFTRASRFLALLKATQGAIKLRERARMKQALLYTRLRHVALAIGDRLVRQGIIADRTDIFFLTTSEADALLSGTNLCHESWVAEIAARRSELERLRSVRAPDHLVLAPREQWSAAREPPPSRESDTDSCLKGSSACGGVARGRAAVLLDVAEADQLEAGQILVTRQTDPGWAAVFFLTGGLVIERGGMLSHGAIIAREYGIPAVVGVPDATRLIRNGDTLCVDGDHGTVHLSRR